ncbi:AcrR family transcriptional regulator [Actinoalloteichus hoggarensis]|uniref:DNA-binding transcriptional repressor AcrR n=1 Tax=Actinoalloteichus hoggarensis TaxID=1470176 RepID=A0A221W4A2_9PSEU|nr:TetR/AcrR family transcriptional regulator [Actinoalloteichus hoggarensis]ASO20533.1 DNA-binding transcriptional repressor AcrR [Actinoalloteichus hoggarensis]MBB5923573.1 AcrR family transcriptional regulator [Actinoalloteichus hoggarensis]
MTANNAARRVRADARLSIERILTAAQQVFSVDPSASLTEVANQAGVTRATVHRHFPSRQTLLDALVRDLNTRYLDAFEQARVESTPPLIALYRLTEAAFELKTSHPFTITLTPTTRSPGSPASDPRIQEKLDTLFARLHASGDITADDPTWCRKVYLALFAEVYDLPADAPTLRTAVTADASTLDARVGLTLTTLLGALGGSPPGR